MQILGQKTKLRPLEERDLDQRAKWVSDPEIAKLMGVIEEPERILTYDDWRQIVRRWFDQRRKSGSFYLYAIEDDSGKLIGDIDLQLVSSTDRMGWLTIEIGEKDYWGKGYGTDAVSALLRYAFRHLGIRQIRLNVKKSNVRAIGCYQKCGFMKEAEQEDEWVMVAVAESCEF